MIAAVMDLPRVADSTETTRPLDLADALRRCAAGEQAALRAIYDAEAPRMIGVAMRILRRRGLAEEAVHDGFVQVWRRAGSFDPSRGEAATWLYAIIRHRALNILRGEARTELIEDFEPLGLADEGEDAETMVARLSEAGALRRCLDRLAPQRRSLVVLAYARGLTHGELAARAGLPLGTVKSWIRRSLAALKECLA